MKYPDRLARRGASARPFHSAIATTFSIEFAAFEEIMLPNLMASGATNFLLIADGRMASMSLSDGTEKPRQLGRDYELLSPPAADGLFHPKIVLQLGRRAGRLFVGSANVTAAGLVGNAEAVIEVECTDEPSPEREVVRAAWRYLEGLILQGSGAARDSMNWAAERATWIDGHGSDGVHTLEDGSGIAFLARDPAVGIARRFVDHVGAGPIERLIVASPYWDERLQALRHIVEALNPATTSLLLEKDGHECPVETAMALGAELRGLPPTLKGRFKHAKFLIASTATEDHLLIGSTNCTVAALGTATFPGSNAEACIYRRLPRGEATRALNLTACLEGAALEADDLVRRSPAPQIPLAQLATARAGSFELEGEVLTWRPVNEFSGPVTLRLLSHADRQLGTIDTDQEGTAIRTIHMAVEKPSIVSFVVVEREGAASAPAHVVHRGALRTRRREVATGAVAKAQAAFDPGADFDLWMHQAFDELARADLADKDPHQISATRPRSQKLAADEKVPRHLTYEEFMETRAQDRREEKAVSTLTGTHSDTVRAFLNMLVGCSPDPAPEADSPEPSDWMNLGDEDGTDDSDGSQEPTQAGIASQPRAEQAPRKSASVDAKHYEKLVRAYVEKVTAGSEPLGQSDVLRLQFWLMMLLQKARHPALPVGLAASADDHGWPRMALRIIAAFFCGRRPPITRVMIAREYTAMPEDFLECWATVLWTLDAAEAALPQSPKSRQFVDFVRRARREVVKMLGLTPAELSGGTVGEVRAALDLTIGARLGVRAPAPLAQAA
jgi:hypothetical protein